MNLTSTLKKEKFLKNVKFCFEFIRTRICETKKSSLFMQQRKACRIPWTLEKLKGKGSYHMHANCQVDFQQLVDSRRRYWLKRYQVLGQVSYFIGGTLNKKLIMGFAWYDSNCPKFSPPNPPINSVCLTYNWTCINWSHNWYFKKGVSYS